MPTNEKFDFALVGAGIMSATLATLIKLVHPTKSIIVFERLALSLLNPQMPGTTQAPATLRCAS